MRILIVDDHEVVRRGIRAVLEIEPSFTLCGEAVDGSDAIEKAKALRPDVVVMDISMPSMNGVEATLQIKRFVPDTEIVIVSQHDTPEMVRQAFNAGAKGYVVKSAVAEDLRAAVTTVFHKGVLLQAGELSDSRQKFDAHEIFKRSATFEPLCRKRRAIPLCHE